MQIIVRIFILQIFMTIHFNSKVIIAANATTEICWSIWTIYIIYKPSLISFLLFLAIFSFPDYQEMHFWNKSKIIVWKVSVHQQKLLIQDCCLTANVIMKCWKTSFVWPNDTKIVVVVSKISLRMIFRDWIIYIIRTHLETLLLMSWNLR